MTDEEYLPKRGDIVQFIGSDGQIGIVAGWIGPDTLSVQDIETKQTLIGSFREGFTVLIKKESYDDMVNALPHIVELTDTEP